MGTIADIEGAVETLVEAIAGAGSVDRVRIDPDDAPRKLRGDTPYWHLTVNAIEDSGKGWGSTDRTLFRWYTVRLEGWQGIQAQGEDTADWKALCESILDAIQTSNAALAAAVTGYKGFFRVAAPAIDIRTWANRARAHHAVITFRIRVFKRLTP